MSEIAETTQVDPGVAPLDQRRVGIVCGSVRIDVSLPAHLELVAVIPELVTMVRHHLRDSAAPGTPVDPDASPPSTGTGVWELARLHGDPLDPADTLARQRVVDGDLLILDRRHIPGPPPLVDDLLEGAATLPGPAPEWAHRDTVRAAVVVAWVLGGVVSGALLWSAGTGSVPTHGPLPTLVSGALAAACLAVVAVGRLVTLPPEAALTASAGLMWFAGLGATTALPGAPGASHLMAALTVVAVLAVLLYATAPTDRSDLERVLHLGVMAAAAPGAVGCATLYLTDAPVHAVCAGLTLVGIVGLTSAPSMSVSLGRIPLPELPDPTDAGTSDRESAPPRPDDPAVTADTVTADEVFPDPAVLAERARAARTAHYALLGGFGALAVVGALLVLASATESPRAAAALAAVVAAVLVLRGITALDRWVVLANLTAALALVTGMLVGALVYAPDPVATVTTGALGVVAATATVAVLAPRVTLSPVVRGALSAVEILLVVAVVPLALVVMGVVQYVRQW